MTTPRRILFLASEHNVSHTGRMVMEHAGYVVTTAVSQDEALAALRQPFDIVVIGNGIPLKEAEAIAGAVNDSRDRPLLVALDNRGHLKADYSLQALAGAEELLAVLGEALIRRHGHEVPEEGCFMFVDENRRYIHVTDAATHLLGYARGELIGRTIDEISAPDMDVSERFQAYVEDGYQKGVFRLRRKDGRIIELAYSAKVLPDGCMVSQLKRVGKPVAGVERLPKVSKMRP